jgi:hypothetical protein
MIRLSSPLLRVFTPTPIYFCNTQTTWEKIQEVTQTIRRTDTTTYVWPNQESSLSRLFSSWVYSDSQGSTDYQRGKAEGYAQGYKDGVKNGIYTTVLYGTSLIGMTTIIHRLWGKKNQ